MYDDDEVDSGGAGRPEPFRIERTAEWESDAGHGPDVVNFYFPVEVVVVGALRDADRLALEERIWESLYDAIERA